MTTVACPGCQTGLSVSKPQPGLVLACPRCGQRFRLPAAPPVKLPPQPPAVAPSTPRITRSVPKPPAVPPVPPPRQLPLVTPPARGRGNSKGVLVAVLVAGCFVLLASGGLAAWFLLTTPSETVAEAPPVKAAVPTAKQTGSDKVVVGDAKDSPGKDKDGAGKAAGSLPPPPRLTPQQVYQRVLRSTVWIYAERGKDAWTGSGSLVHLDRRLVLTNQHVVKDEKEVAVLFPRKNDQGELIREKDHYVQQLKNKNFIRGEVVARDKRRDLALIKLEALPPDVPALRVARASADASETVQSIGNPGASDALWVATSGAVRGVYHKKWQSGGGSDVTEHDATVVETQLPTNFGDSGGPMVNDRGELLGVTQGAVPDVRARLISFSIDRREVLALLETLGVRAEDVLAPETYQPVGETVVQLIARLNHADANVRIRAAQELGQLGSPDARPAVPALLKAAAKHPEPDSVRYLLDALNRIGPPAKVDVACLVEALQPAAGREVRLCAAEMLGKLGPDAKPAIAALAAALKDADPSLRQQAARTLGKIGPAVKDATYQDLILALRDADRDVRLAAEEALANIDAPTLADVPFLRKSLHDQTSVEVRSYAAGALGRVGPDAKPAAFEDLMQALKDPEMSVRTTAAGALFRFGPPSRAEVPPLLKALQDRASTDVRAFAATALGRVGPDVRDQVLADLLVALKDSDQAVRTAAAGALKNVGPPTKANVPALQAALEDRTGRDDARLYAARALGDIGAEAEAAVPALSAALAGDAEKPLLCAAAAALGKIAAPTREAGQALTKAVQHPDKEVCLIAATALTRLGAQSSTLAGFIKALEHADQTVREVVQKSLWPVNTFRWSAAYVAGSQTLAVQGQSAQGAPELRLRLGSLGKDDVPVLTAGLASKEAYVRKFAAFVLTALGPAARDAVPPLRQTLRDPSVYVRTEALSALAAIGKDAKDNVKEALPDVTALLKSKDEPKPVRTCAAMALVMVGEEAPEAIPVLVRALKAEDLGDAAQLALRHDAHLFLVKLRKPAAEPLLKALEEFAGRDQVYGEARLAVVQTLTKIGRDAYSLRALQVLVYVQNTDPYPDVRKAAAEARRELQRKD